VRPVEQIADSLRARGGRLTGQRVRILRALAGDRSHPTAEELHRRLLAGTGFTIEPGVYFDDFGVRTEINMVVAARDAAVTGPLQTEILRLV